MAIQLSYTNAAGATIRVNPYFDFTLDASGKSVAVTAAQTRQMVDIATCNTCHDKLALHGGGRVDTQFCVTCHNTGTTDANSGNVLTLSTMVHKIHAGKLLAEEGEDYTIWGNSNSKHDYARSGLPAADPQLRQVPHGSQPEDTAGRQLEERSQQGSLPELPPVRCDQRLVCQPRHHPEARCLGRRRCRTPPARPATVPSSQFARRARALGPGNGQCRQLYQSKIESVTLKKAATATAAGKLTVKYSVVNPATGAAYDLREGCAAAATSRTPPAPASSAATPTTVGTPTSLPPDPASPPTSSACSRCTWAPKRSPTRPSTMRPPPRAMPPTAAWTTARTTTPLT